MAISTIFGAWNKDATIYTYMDGVTGQVGQVLT